MPYGMPHVVAKGPVLRALETYLNDKMATPQGRTDVDNDVYKKVAAGVHGPQLAEIFKNTVFPHVGFIPDGVLYNHTRTHWFNWLKTSGVWWKKHQPIEPLSKYALWYALKLNYDRTKHFDADKTGALPPLPYAFYWLCMKDFGRGAWNGFFRRQSFQVNINVSAHQITVNIITPMEPDEWETELNTPENLFMVRLLGWHRDPDVGEDVVDTRSFEEEEPSRPSPFHAEIIQVRGAPDETGP